MTPREKSMIDELFDRIYRTPPTPRDAEAAALIAGRVAADPNAAYALTQIALIQGEALRNAEARINELERAPAPAASGSFLSGVRGPWGSVPPTAARPEPAPGPSWAAPPAAGQMPPLQAPGQAGGFLRSALTTAAGVAGGALLFEGVRNMFGGHGFGGGGFGGMSGTPVVNETINENVYIDQTSDRRDDQPADVANDSLDSTDWNSNDDDLPA
jgi:hypothetical protein